MARSGPYRDRRLFLGVKGVSWLPNTKTSTLDHGLRSFSLRGVGLKNCVHPLAIAIALNQLRKLGDFYKVKTNYVSMLLNVIREILFLEGPQLSSIRSPNVWPAWYVLWFRFKTEFAPKDLTREVFVASLRDHGMTDVDIPKSTCLLHNQLLFTNPKMVLPAVYSDDTFFVAKVQ